MVNAKIEMFLNGYQLPSLLLEEESLPEPDWLESPPRNAPKGQVRVLSTRSDEYNLFLHVSTGI